MLKPTFSEKTALLVRDRIIAWLLKSLTYRWAWEISVADGDPFVPESCTYHFRYDFPEVRDLASGTFDDVSDSVLLRVLKDMHNLGTIKLHRPHTKGAGMADNSIELNERFLSEVPSKVQFGPRGNPYYFTGKKPSFIEVD
jgi:hypothetical protein